MKILIFASVVALVVLYFNFSSYRSQLRELDPNSDRHRTATVYPGKTSSDNQNQFEANDQNEFNIESEEDNTDSQEEMTTEKMQ